jgi:hypothetical protein
MVTYDSHMDHFGHEDAARSAASQARNPNLGSLLKSTRRGGIRAGTIHPFGVGQHPKYIDEHPASSSLTFSPSSESASPSSPTLSSAASASSKQLLLDRKGDVLVEAPVDERLPAAARVRLHNREDSLELGHTEDA